MVFATHSTLDLFKICRFQLWFLGLNEMVLSVVKKHLALMQLEALLRQLVG